MTDAEKIVAVHTADYASRFAARLVAEGIEARIHPIDSDGRLCRITVPADDLPKTVALTESSEFNVEITKEKPTGSGNKVLIPVDFSQTATGAVKVGFQFADRLGDTPYILHSFVPPSAYGESKSIGSLYADKETRPHDNTQETADNAAAEMMRGLTQDIANHQARGTMPRIKFTSEVARGIPEEVILERAKELSPTLIVMATRGIHRKAEELIGSVTAEVMDSCRVPIFTVPTEFPPEPVYNIRKVAFISSLTSSDIFAMQRLNEIFPDRDYDITLVPITDSLSPRSFGEKAHNLEKYFATRYPSSRFHTTLITDKKFREGFDRFADKNRPGMIVVPNRKRNAFARLFNPGIAHRILFQADVPMLVIPV